MSADRVLAVIFATATSAGCELECALPDCDIREATCQHQVADTIACVRGGDPGAVELRVVDASTYIDEAATGAGSADDAPCTRRWYRALALLDLTSPDLDPAAATQSRLSRVAAFYSRDDDAVTVLDRHEPLRGKEAAALLFHEFVHALQDAELDLTTWYDEHRTSFDSGLAMSSIVEGEAVLYTDQAMAHTRGFDPDGADWERGYSAYRDFSLADAVAAADPFLVLFSDFAYAYGASYVADALRAGGDDAVRALYTDPPTSTRAIMAFDRDVPLDVELDDEVAKVPSVAERGLRYVGSARLGSYALGVLLRRYSDSTEYWAEHGRQLFPVEDVDTPYDDGIEIDLVGDVLSLFATSDGTDVLLSWRLRFGNEDAAVAAAAIVRRGLDRLVGRESHEHQVWRKGTLLSIVTLTDAAASTAFLSELEWSAAPVREAAESDFQCRTEMAADPFRTVAVGTKHACVVQASGGVRCFGEGELGRLGYASTESIGDDETAVSAGEVDVRVEAVSVTAGDEHTCALAGDGSVRCWGRTGAIGYADPRHVGDDESPADAGAVDVGGTVTQLAAGYGFTCALLDTGRVRCWGSNSYGQLGYGDLRTVGSGNTPASAGDLDLGTSVTQIATGEAHVCALLEGGRVRCWGRGIYGVLGYGGILSENIGDDETPAEAGDVPIAGNVARIAAGTAHTCALLDTTRVRCWGNGDFGQLGDEQVASSSLPVGSTVDAANARDVDVGGNVVNIACGTRHTCALLDTGAVRCWGANASGQLGYGHTETIGDDEPPARSGDVDIGGKVVSIAAGGDTTCVILENGRVRCWGANDAGQLGYGHTDDLGDDESPASAGDVPL